MNFTTLKHRFDNHYLLKLLRSKHGPLFISFIILEFKTNHIVSIEFNTLIIKLCNHLEECSWEIPENQEIEEYSRKLIENWCNDDYRLLRRFYSKNAEMFIELTVDSERSIKWMEELNPKEYIGSD
ncbi:MAG: hypothetical protein B6229_10770 [Spirochaetaceae bacterium 4572_7]|nr:MAG: hypothetical protein B6229_10770 [Spirochaetaceae bacterium 4572_7]